MSEVGSTVSSRSQPVKVLIISPHPVQYAAPIYRLYAQDPSLDLTVAYCSLEGAEKALDPLFGIEVQWDVPILEGYRWVHPPNRSPKPERGPFFGSFNPGLWKLIRRRNFDIVMCWGYRNFSYWIAFLAAKISGAAFVWGSEAHNWMSRKPKGWKPAVKGFVLPRIYGSGDACIALSSATVRFLESLGIEKSRIFLTPYVVDNDFFRTGAKKADRLAFRREHGIPEDAVVALLCGKLVPYKRPVDLVEAAAMVDGLHIAFAGEGQLRSAIEAAARARGIENRVHFLGFVNQTGLPAVYAMADVLAVPSELENFPLVVPEAMACGLPVVETDTCSSVGDLVVDGETGYVIQVGDVETLANRLRTLAQDEGLRREMSSAALDRMATWGPEQNAEAFSRACLAIATRKGR